MACIAVGTYEGRLFGWDVQAPSNDTTDSDAATSAAAGFTLSYAFGAHEGPVRCVAVDDTGKFFVTGGADESIRFANSMNKCVL